jgi:hypothetical protein
VLIYPDDPWLALSILRKMAEDPGDWTVDVYEDGEAAICCLESCSFATTLAEADLLKRLVK